MYSEETELTVRFHKTGALVMNVPDSKIIHLEAKSHAFKEDRERLMLQGRNLYYRKVYGEG
jgi:GT2 family glycosyltransferase